MRLSKRWVIRSVFAGFLLAGFPSASLAGPPHPSEEALNKIFAQDVINQLTSIDSAQTPTDRCFASNIGPAGLTVLDPDYTWLRNALSRWQCSDIFGSRVPEFVQHKQSDSAKQSDSSQPSDLWWPVCTAVALDSSPAGNTYQSAYTSVTARVTTSWDFCATPASNRYSESYELPSQRQSGLVPMNAKQRLSLQTEIKQIHEDETQACCGSDSSDCAKLMNSIEVKWCNPESDPEKPEPCIQGGTFYLFTDEDGLNKLHDYQTKKLKEKSGFNDFPFTIGYVQLSPFLDKSSGKPSYPATAGVIRHEFSHACSSIRRQLEIPARGQPALDGFINRFSEKTWCEVTPAVLQSYRDLYKSFGLNETSSDCLIDTAKGAVSQRFNPGEKCENGCPASYLEESFADFLPLASAPKDRIMAEVENRCAVARDSLHPLSWDTMSCFTQTPSIRAKIEQGIECKK